MHFSEDELREALRRKDPGERFTKEVIARIAEGRTEVTAPSYESRFRQFLRGLTLRPVLSGAMAVILALSFGILEYRHVQEKRAGEVAKRQALLALRITNSKLNHVLERVKPPAGAANEERRP